MLDRRLQEWDSTRGYKTIEKTVIHIDLLVISYQEDRTDVIITDRLKEDRWKFVKRFVFQILRFCVLFVSGYHRQVSTRSCEWISSERGQTKRVWTNMTRGRYIASSDARRDNVWLSEWWWRIETRIGCKDTRDTNVKTYWRCIYEWLFRYIIYRIKKSYMLSMKTGRLLFDISREEEDCDDWILELIYQW